MFKFFLVLITSLFLFGCTPTHLYQGTKLPENKLAKLYPNNGARIIAVDDKEVSKNPLSVFLIKPGKHKVTAEYGWREYNNDFWKTRKIRPGSKSVCFIAKEGLRYFAGSKPVGNQDFFLFIYQPFNDGQIENVPCD